MWEGRVSKRARRDSNWTGRLCFLVFFLFLSLCCCCCRRWLRVEQRRIKTAQLTGGSRSTHFSAQFDERFFSLVYGHTHTIDDRFRSLIIMIFLWLSTFWTKNLKLFRFHSEKPEFSTHFTTYDLSQTRSPQLIVVSHPKRIRRFSCPPAHPNICVHFQSIDSEKRKYYHIFGFVRFRIDQSCRSQRLKISAYSKCCTLRSAPSLRYHTHLTLSSQSIF